MRWLLCAILTVLPVLAAAQPTSLPPAPFNSRLANWPTAQRPPAADQGTLGYNTSLGTLDLWNGSAWVQPLASGANQSANLGTGALTAVGIASSQPGAIGYLDATTEPGVDPTGTTDSTAGLRAALATGKAVYVPCGNYKIDDDLTVAANGFQRFYSDGWCTNFEVGPNFNSAAPGVLVAAGNGDTGAAQFDDFAITFTQPPDAATTATAAASGTSVTVASTAGIAVGNYVYDLTAPARVATVPPFVTVQSISGTTLTLSASTTIAANDNLHFAPARSQFVSLATGCSATANGTGCAYPWAIYGNGAQVSGGLGRIIIHNVRVNGAWNGISITGPGGGFDIDGVKMGAINNGLSIDDLGDSGTIQNWKFWDFGFDSNNYAALHFTTWTDLGTDCMTPGRTDGGSFKNIQCYMGNIALLPTFTWGSFNDINLDGYGSDFVVPSGMAATSFLNVSGLHAESGGAVSTCQVDISNGIVNLTGVLLQDSAGQSDLCVRGGSVTASAGYLNDFDKNQPAVLETGGALTMTGLHIQGSAGGQAVAPIQITGGHYYLSAINITSTSWVAGTPSISVTASCPSYMGDSIVDVTMPVGVYISDPCPGFFWPNSDRALYYNGSQSGLLVPVVSTIVPVQTLNTIGNATLLNGHIFSGVLTRGGTQTANFTDTTPTAASLVGNFLSPVTSQSTRLRILNNTGYTETIAGGTGVTMGGAATLAPGTWRDFNVTLTNVTSGSQAVQITNVGSGTL